MKRAGEVAVAEDIEGLVGEKELAHALELHARLHVVGLLRPVGEIHIAARQGFGAVRIQIDAIQAHMRAVDDEARLHVGPERHVVLDRHGAVAEYRGTAVLGHMADVDVEVGRDDAPRRLVVLVGELPSPRPQIPERRREPLGALRFLVARELGEVMEVLPLLHQHLPVGHLDR